MYNWRIIKKGLANSWAGIAYIFRTERNFRAEVIMAVLALSLLLIFPTTATEAAIIVLTITLVLLLEILNTLVERFADALKPKVHPFVRHIKDMAAGMVLLSVIASIIIGLFIFLPYVTSALRVADFIPLW